jgi:hypothetical protein
MLPALANKALMRVTGVAALPCKKTLSPLSIMDTAASGEVYIVVCLLCMVRQNKITFAS